MAEKRSSNFEILRIAAMLMIIAHHFSFFGGFTFDAITFHNIWTEFLAIGGKIAVNIYILISGYFLINSRGVSIKKVLKLVGQVLFYSLVIDAIALAVGYEQLSIKAIIKSIFPITFDRWWFASAYIVLYLLSPYINVFLKKLDKQTYRRFLLTLFVLWCIIPTATGSLYQSNTVLWFLFLYSSAAYVRVFGVRESSAAGYLFLALAVGLLVFAVVIILDILGIRYPAFSGKIMHVFALQRLPAFLCAWLTFLGFRSIKVRYIPAVNITASAAFGVYLIHEHPVVRRLLWTNLFPGRAHIDETYFPIYSILVVLSIFAVCTLIELVRVHTLERIWMKLAEKIEGKIKCLAAGIKNRMESRCE